MILLPPATVTVTFSSLPMPKALERLSAAAGERLECAPAFRDQPLFVRLRDADEERVLKEIAELCDARWERRPGGRMLLPDPAAARRRAAREDAASAQTLEGSLAYLKRRLAEQPTRFTPADAVANERKRKAEDAARKIAEERNDPASMFTASTADEETPAWRAAARIVPLLGESTLLALPNDSRTVWSDVPTPAQRLLPVAAAPALRAYHDELTAFKPDAEVARVRLVATRWESGGAFNVSFQALDRAGKAVDKAFLRMNDDMDRMRHRSTVFDVPPPPSGEKPLSLPDELREYDAIINVREQSPARAAVHNALLPKWAPRLADPVAYEPSQWLPAARLVLAADALDRNLIGLPGEVSGARYDRSHDGETPSQLLRNIPVKEGWSIVDPERSPLNSRDAAKRFLQKAIKQGGVSVDDAAAWAARSDGPYGVIDWVGNHVATLLSGEEGPYGAMSNLMDGNGLRLWAALGPTREVLREGKRLSLGDLPPAAQRRVAEIAYWHGGIQGGEPTEVLPNGIDGGTVSLTVAETPLVVLSSSKGPEGGATMPLSSEMLGQFLAKGDRYREVSAEAYRGYDRYRIGVSRAYTLHFLLGHEAVPMDEELDETFFDPKAPVLTALPEPFAKQVEAARAKAAGPTKG